MAANILITGATGFLGAHLVRQLLVQGQQQIRALKRPTSQLDLLGPLATQVEWVEGDVLDIFALEEALDGIEQVYHCAGLVSFHPADRRMLRRTNVEGTANVVNLCLDLGVKKLLHVSSVAAIGRTKATQELTESSSWQESPYNTYYGISKFWAEQEVWRGIAEGLQAVIINPSIILGAGRWHEGTGRFFSTVQDGLRYFPLGTAALVDVQDVVRMMIQLMNGPFTEQRFIANGVNLPYREFLIQLAALLGVRPPQIPATRWRTELAWRWAAVQSSIKGEPPFLTRETARQARLDYHYSNRKSLETLGFNYTPLADTLAQLASEWQRYREARGA